jgi:Spy/CpxP family protein refolding chaperone
MKTLLKTAIIASLLFGVMIVSSQAAAMKHHHPGDEAAMPADTRNDMMMQKMEMMQGKDMMDDKPCMTDGSPCSKPCMGTATTPRGRHHKKGAGMSGMMSMDHDMMGMKMGMKPDMMHKRMDHELFLDRVESLELTTDQVTRLKTIRSDCRKENIRNAAEVKIVRLELKDLLNEADWTLDTAEPLIRKVQILEGDMLVHHLQAVTEARKVLSAGQLQKADSGGDNDDLEKLFE